MQQLGQHVTDDGVHLLPLPLVELGRPAPMAIELGPAQLLDSGPQGGRPPGPPPGPSSARYRSPSRATISCGELSSASPSGQGPFGVLGEVVHVEQLDPGERAHGGVDVAGHPQVDDHQRGGADVVAPPARDAGRAEELGGRARAATPAVDTSTTSAEASAAASPARAHAAPPTRAASVEARPPVRLATTTWARSPCPPRACTMPSPISPAPTTTT